MRKAIVGLSAGMAFVGCIEVKVPAPVEIAQPSAPAGTDPAVECLSKGFRFDPVLKVCVRELDSSQCNTADVQIITSARRGPATDIRHGAEVTVDLVLFAHRPAMLEHVIVSAPGFEQFRIERVGKLPTTPTGQDVALLTYHAELVMGVLNHFRISTRVRDDAVLGPTTVEISAVQIRLTESGKVTPCVWGGGVLKEFEIKKKLEPPKPTEPGTPSPPPTPAPPTPPQPVNPCDRGEARPDAYVELLMEGMHVFPGGAPVTLQRIAVTACYPMGITGYSVPIRAHFSSPSLAAAPMWQGFFGERGLPTLQAMRFDALAGRGSPLTVLHSTVLDYDARYVNVNDHTYIVDLGSSFSLQRGERIEFRIHAQHIGGIPSNGEACFSVRPPVLRGGMGGEPIAHPTLFEFVGGMREYVACVRP